MNRLNTLLASLLTLSGIASAAPGTEPLPVPLAALEHQGLHITGAFKSSSGLKGYAGVVDGHPVALYLTPDGKFAIAGTMLDSNGNAVDREAIASAAAQPLGAADWKRLEEGGWLADGKPTAARVVYVFTDPNCPYCAKLWADARPWVDSGKVQLRHIIVGILTPTSPAKAAALLSAKNPSEALRAYEASHAPAIVKALAAGGRPHALGDEGLKPLEGVPAAMAARLDANAKLMASFGLQATPGVVWKDSAEVIHKSAGVPDSELVQLFGPR
jgi:thiol:disulfide interchange protein DsbG